MSTSWQNFRAVCKSRFSALARGCFLGRYRWKQKYIEAVARSTEQVEELERCVAEHVRRISDLQTELDNANYRIQEDQKQIRELVSTGVRLPEDQHVGGQHYGAKTIELSVNLTRKIGLRGSQMAMKEFFSWLGVKKEVPTYQAIRTWMQRIGLNRIESAPKKSDRIWLVDESNQIGQEKCMVVLGIQKSRLPEAGTALKHKDLEVLAIYPGKKWDGRRVQTAYSQISKRCGCPEGVLTDGANELRDPLEILKNKGKSWRSFRDPKHFLANRVEAFLSHNEEFRTFQKQLNTVRSSMQQTELAHLAPPAARIKSRFMNLGPILSWAQMALWQLDHPKSDGRKGISEDRMNEKLEWLTDYRSKIQEWSELQTVTDIVLKETNTQGLTHQTKKTLEKSLSHITGSANTRTYIEQVLTFVGEQQVKLKPNERIPFSTEILESSFGLFKGLEKYRARNGFTQLVLAFPCMLKRTTAKEVTRAFGQTKIADVKKWLDKRLPTTVDARRIKAHRETRPSKSKTAKTNRATVQLATG